MASHQLRGGGKQDLISRLTVGGKEKIYLALNLWQGLWLILSLTYFYTKSQSSNDVTDCTQTCYVMSVSTLKQPLCHKSVELKF